MPALTAGAAIVAAQPVAAAENVAGAAQATASSSQEVAPASAAVDSHIDGWPGHPDWEWASSGEGAGAWIRLTWDTPQEITEVRLWDRPNARDQATGGTLTFSDGSSEPVGSLANGAESPGTVSFSPKSVTWLQFDVTSVKQDTAAVGLAELEVIGTSQGGEPTCEEFTICVVSPEFGSTVDGDTTIKLYAPGMQNLAARGWPLPDGGEPSDGYDDWFVQSTEPDANGYVELVFPADSYPQGPTTVLLSAWDSPPGDPNYTHSDNVYLQLYNSGGTAWSAGTSTAPPQAAGMALAYEDDFNGPLSASRTGENATYAAALPWEAGGTEFGEAHFADPNGPYNPFTVVDNEYLRIRGSDAPADFEDPMGWNREHIGGLLSSLRTDGTGFSAQYGYFEARIMSPPGEGPWPAFWLMSTERVTEGLSTWAAELDVVEQHAQSISMKRSAQSQHCWRCDPETHDTNVESSFSYGDSGRTWHTYGVKVTPTETIYYIDDVETWRQPTLEPAKGELFFMVDLAMGGGWPIDLSQYGGQVDMWVDYIRVYE